MKSSRNQSIAVLVIFKFRSNRWVFCFSQHVEGGRDFSAVALLNSKIWSSTGKQKIITSTNQYHMSFCHNFPKPNFVLFQRRIWVFYLHLYFNLYLDLYLNLYLNFYLNSYFNSYLNFTHLNYLMATA